MKKNDLKRMLKPLIKECVQEMILEEGLLKNIVSEVASGMQGNLVTETNIIYDLKGIVPRELKPMRL